METLYNVLIVFGIFLLIVVIIIILFVPNNSINLQTNSNLAVQSVSSSTTTAALITLTPVGFATFTINNSFSDGSSAQNYLLDITNLNFTTSNPDYISINTGSYGNGFDLLKTGRYSFTINFNVATQNIKNFFSIYTLLTYTSSITIYATYNNLTNSNGGVYNGPTFLEVNYVSYCSQNNPSVVIHEYPQKYYGNNSSSDFYACPIIELEYGCKSDSSGNCYPNYYVFSGILNLTQDDIDRNQTIYIQFAFGQGGTSMTGNGSINLTYIY